MSAPCSGLRNTCSARRRDACTNCCIRSAACVAVTRLCVRPVLWPCGFPLVVGLRSTDSAVACAPLFAGFATTMPMSDSFGSFIFGLAYTFPPRSRRRPAGTTRSPPRSRYMTYVCARILRRRGARSDFTISTSTRIAFDRHERLGHSPQCIFRICRRSIVRTHAPLPTLRLHPCGSRRTARGVTWIGYSFVPRDFHALSYARQPDAPCRTLAAPVADRLTTPSTRGIRWPLASATLPFHPDLSLAVGARPRPPVVIVSHRGFP